MAAVTLLQTAMILFVVVYLVINTHILIQVKPASRSVSNPPKVSVCVPARDEERDLESCLVSLLNQDYPDYEVIVVDDHSTDGTPNIIAALQSRYPHLVTVQGAPLPADWYGKPYALHQASQVAQGDVLLFTDADPVFEPHALTTAVHFMRDRQLDLLTLFPRGKFGSFWERAIQPVVFAFIGALTRLRKVNDPRSPSAMAVGAFIMVRRDIYERAGGHQPLRQAILEDIGMGRLVKRSGGKIMIADGRHIYSIRMYHSFREIWVGWRKNIFLAMRKSVLKTFFYIFWILGFLVTPWGVAGYHWWAGSALGWQLLASGGLLAVLTAGGVLCHELGLRKYTLILFPLGALVMAAIMVNSMIHVLFRGRSEWRGRIYMQPEK